MVLLFKLNDSDQVIIYAFLRRPDRSVNEYYPNRHAVHLDPGRHEHGSGTYLAHLVIDMEADDLQNPALATLPHEIYKVKHDEDRQMYVI